MRLIRKTNTYYILLLSCLLPVMVIIHYLFFSQLLHKEAEGNLVAESQRIISHLDKQADLPASTYIIKSTPAKTAEGFKSRFKDTLILDPSSNKTSKYRLYEFSSNINGQPSIISIKHALPEMKGLIGTIILANLIIMLLILLGLYLINHKIYQVAWKPFFESLLKLKSYNVVKEDPIILKPSEVAEFEELNTMMTSLINRVKKDFQNLKEFNENISHELQTPLAVIRNKAVLLLESKNLDETDLKRVEAIYQESNKLSKIGKSLTLISRIENQEFKRMDRVDLRSVVKNILSNMEEMIAFKELEVETELNAVTIECDHILADILITNLIKNAVQHNLNGGTINILLTDEKFEILNSGKVSTLETEKLFNRFERDVSSKESLGLGLAINQRICEIYGFQLSYAQRENLHAFSLFFNRANL